MEDSLSLYGGFRHYLTSDIITLRSLAAKIFYTLHNNAFVSDTVLIIVVYKQGIKFILTGEGQHSLVCWVSPDQVG